MFARQGFAHTSVAQVAQHAGVSTATILWHFGNKEGLLLAVVKKATWEWLEGLEREISQGEEEGARRQLERAMDGYLALATQQPDFCTLYLLLLMEGIGLNRTLTGEFQQITRRCREMFVAILERGKEEGVFRPDFDSFPIAASLLGAIDGLFMQWALDRGAFDLCEAFQGLRNGLARGIEVR